VVRRYFLGVEDTWPLSERFGEFTERLGRFCASLPGAAATAVSAEIPGSQKSDLNAGRGRDAGIAIVDDDQWAREGFNALIASLGHSAATFISAEEYLASEFKLYAACLIVDVHLPGMSGPDLQAHLVAEGCTVPIVFVTALFDERVRERVIEAGALGYLVKPCDESALISCLVQALGN
jgi:CheY-like chemotaxis protein